jgi:hypothetical protein
MVAKASTRNARTLIPGFIEEFSFAQNGLLEGETVGTPRASPSVDSAIGGIGSSFNKEKNPA